ncbi:hypothetical protein U9M48_025691 [Paspalum notatum var. saurae]|uniref:DUF6598 domain-containing protein n=1 Tax=Paspalum notatum var. saurae TaxID=547442 RepID=A0AAQ3WXZ3_PASNO
MQVLSRSFLRLLRSSPNVTTPPAPLCRLSYHLSASPALPRRQVFPPMAAPNSPVRHVCRSPHGYRNMASGVGVKSEELGKPDGRLQLNYGDGSPAAHGDENDAFRATAEVIDGECDTVEEILDNSDSDDDMMYRIGEVDLAVDGVYPLYRLPGSRHRDGSVYKYRSAGCWRSEFHIADRSETRLEAMKLSDPSNCILLADGSCMKHQPCPMLQFFSLKLAKHHVDSGPVELYGYIAVRDELEPLLNYVINFSRDDPIVVEQGSVINMAGPKRGIELFGTVLIEYDMRIKTGKQGEDDLQLIDGVSLVDKHIPEHHVFRGRILGKRGAIDIAVSHIDYAVEANIEVLISEVYSSFNLYLGCFTSGLHEEIQLFDGIIGKPCGLKRSVVAVRWGFSVDLKFRVCSESSISADHRCSFVTNPHGCVGQEIKTDLALISVKVTWSTLP